MSIKIFYDGECRRVRIDEENFSYGVLVHFAHTFFPPLRSYEVINFHWTDEEGDQIVLSSDDELEEARRLNPTLLRLEIAQNNSAHSTAFAAVHRGVTCNECGVSPINGIRYKCTVRHDFDLCANCESRRPQPYDMIKIYTPQHKRNHRDMYIYADIDLADILGHRRGRYAKRCARNSRQSTTSNPPAAPDSCCGPSGSSTPPQAPTSSSDASGQSDSEGPSSSIDPHLATLIEDARRGAFGPHIANIASQMPVENFLQTMSQGHDAKPLLDLIGQFTAMRPCGACPSEGQQRQPSEEERIEKQFVDAAINASMHSPGDEAHLKDPNPAPVPAPNTEDLDRKLDKWHRELDTLYAMGFDDLEALIPLLEEYTEVKQMSTPDALQRIVAELLLRRR